MSIRRWLERHRWLIKERPEIDAEGAGATLREEYGADRIQRHRQGDYYAVAGQAVQGPIGIGLGQPDEDVASEIDLGETG